MIAAPIFGQVYVHTNIVNGKNYVGQTTAGMENRWKLHLRCARSTKTPAYAGLIARAIRKYGVDAFEHHVLSVVGSQARLDNLEKVWIILLQAKTPTGYNLADGGYAAAGHKVSSEVRARLSAATKLQWMNPEFREWYSRLRRGKKAHPNTIAACVASHLGKKQSAETIAKRVATRFAGIAGAAERHAAQEGGRTNGA